MKEIKLTTNKNREELGFVEVIENVKFDKFLGTFVLCPFSRVIAAVYDFTFAGVSV